MITMLWTHLRATFLTARGSRAAVWPHTVRARRWPKLAAYSARTIPSDRGRVKPVPHRWLLGIVSFAVPAVFLFATLDTKGREAAYVRDLLTSWGVAVTLVDVGALGSPAVPADVPRERVFELSGTTLTAVRQAADRGQAVTSAAEGAARIAREAFARGELSGVLALGGSAGTTIGTAAM